MTAEQLERDIAAGVTFWGVDDGAGDLVGVMGIQSVQDVDLIRHAYVRPDKQGGGVGGQLLAHLERLSDRAILIGTWRAATWAIAFYQRHGYMLVDAAETAPLLRRYWTVSPRQIETSVVLARP
jgi:GNAT superfamily N-acetyltransferase